jgi:hypothetical protein
VVTLCVTPYPEVIPIGLNPPDQSRSTQRLRNGVHIADKSAYLILTTRLPCQADHALLGSQSDGPGFSLSRDRQRSGGL